MFALDSLLGSNAGRIDNSDMSKHVSTPLMIRGTFLQRPVSGQASESSASSIRVQERFNDSMVETLIRAQSEAKVAHAGRGTTACRGVHNISDVITTIRIYTMN